MIKDLPMGIVEIPAYSDKHHVLIAEHDIPVYYSVRHNDVFPTSGLHTAPMGLELDPTWTPWSGGNPYHTTLGGFNCYSGESWAMTGRFIQATIPKGTPYYASECRTKFTAGSIHIA